MEVIDCKGDTELKSNPTFVVLDALRQCGGPSLLLFSFDVADDDSRHGLQSMEQN
jgi:hypothetical protein